MQALGSDKWSGDYRNIIDRDWFSTGTTKSPSADKSYVLDNLMTQNIVKTSGKWAIEIVRKSDGVTGRVEYTGSPKDVFTCAVSGGHCEMTYAAKFTDNTGVRYSGNTKVCYNTQSKYCLSLLYSAFLSPPILSNRPQVPRLSRRCRHELHGQRLRRPQRWRQYQLRLRTMDIPDPDYRPTLPQLLSIIGRKPLEQRRPELRFLRVRGLDRAGRRRCSRCVSIQHCVCFFAQLCCSHIAVNVKTSAPLPRAKGVQIT